MATYFAGSLSTTDVQAAMNSGSAGDTIVLPNGTGVWNTAVGANSAFTLKGGGTGNTLIQMGPGLSNDVMMYVEAGATFRDFSVSGDAAKLFNVFANGFRITNIHYRSNNSPPYFAFVNGFYGLIDNCVIDITASTSPTELVFIVGPSNAWQTPSQCGTANNVFIEDCTFYGPGYVCDNNANGQGVVRFCTINGDMKVDSHGFASNTPRGVRSSEIYNNTWINATYAAQIRGGDGFIFNNTYDAANLGSNWWQILDYGCESYWPNFGVQISGVSATNPCVITTTTPHRISGNWLVGVDHNSSTPPLSNPFGFTSYQCTLIDAYNISVPVAVTNGGTNGDGYVAMYQTPVNYPITDQIGVGQDPKKGGSQPMYIWNQGLTTSGVIVQNWPLNWIGVSSEAITLYQQQTNNTGASFTMQTMISGGRDYFLQTFGTPFQGTGDIGVGTSAQMLTHTPTQSGVGWWATDTGNWNLRPGASQGVLFQWNGTTWKPFYTPYTYPNPQRGIVFPIYVYQRIGAHPKLTALVQLTTGSPG